MGLHFTDVSHIHASCDLSSLTISSVGFSVKLCNVTSFQDDTSGDYKKCLLALATQ